MSLHHQFIFPRYPHRAPPDWRGLEARLLADGYLLAPRGAQVPRADLFNLGMRLAGLKEGSFQYRDGMRTPGDVIALYRDAGHLPAAMPVRHDDTMQETLELLARHGITPDARFLDDESSTWRSPYYCLGPAVRDCLRADLRAQYDADPAAFGALLLAYDRPEPYVAAGENLSPPTLPDSDEPLEALPPIGTYLDLLGAAYEDPAVQWRNPDDGRDYHLFDLDWQYSLALGYRMIRTDCLDRDSAEALARVVAGIADQPMACSHRHL